MTVAPPFFLVAVAFAIGFFFAVISLGLLIKKTGGAYPEAKLTRPFKTVLLIAFLTVLLNLILILPFSAIASAAPVLAIPLPPFLFWFFVVGFVVILFRLDGDLLSVRKAKVALCLSGASVLWLILVERVVLYVIT